MGRELLEEITKWKLEAKLEDSQRYFYPTHVVDLIESGARSYIIGRKGTGKTAISEHLNQEENYQRFSTKLNFKNFPFNDLYALENSSFRTPNQYITLWKYLIYSSIAKMMMRNENIDSTIRAKLNRIYSDDPEKSLPRTLTKWVGKNYEFKILDSGFSGGSSQTLVDNDVPWIERVEILERLIEKYIDDSTYLVIFDELDEDYKDIIELQRREQYTALLTGLFKAVQDVKSVFKTNEYKVLPVVFLRDDIYGLIKDPDKTKWSDLSISLDWNTEKIKKLLAFRISRAINPTGDILEFSEAWARIFLNRDVKYGLRQRRKIPTFDFITRSSLIRPRDYIRYMQLCAEAALDQDYDLVGPVIITQGDRAFSNYMRSEIEDEIHGALPEISQLLDTVAHLGKPTFRFNEFLQAYKLKVNRGLLPDRNPELILQILFFFSVIGNQPSNIQIFRYLDKEARLNLNQKLCIHRGLYKALQIF